jgi:eukaryotic-like serine/threonine-protein kinase
MNENKEFDASIILEPDGKMQVEIPSGTSSLEDHVRPLDSTSKLDNVTPECKGRYQLGREHGRGGQARVMLALDLHMGREIALKELAPDLAHGLSGQQQSSNRSTMAVARFLREARITGQLEHPNIVPVYEVGRREDGRVYYTMRLVRGRTLKQVLSECSGLPDRIRLLAHFTNVCHAVAFAHSRGIVHRDIKPDNIMVGEFGETVLLDWGLAKVRGKEDIREKEIRRQMEQFQQGSQSETIDGAALGTPSYMSPEQAEGLVEEIDEKSDVWGLGAVLFEILTGRPPFVGETPYEIVGLAMRESVKPVGECLPDAPLELAAVADKALQREKNLRYASARELAEDVSAYMTGGKVGAHEYTSWDLLKRFASKNKPALVASLLILLAVIVMLVVVSLAYQQESQARKRESDERFQAHFHLAQAYAREAGRLMDEMQPLSARILSTASLTYNPANPKSPFYGPDFSSREPSSERLKMEADSGLYRTQHRWVDRFEAEVNLNASVYQAAYDPDSKWLAIVDHAGYLTFVESESGKETLRFQAATEPVLSLAFFPDGKRIVTGSEDGTLKIWDVGIKRPTLILVASAQAQSLSVSPDGKRVAAGLSNGSTKIWECIDGSFSKELPPHGEKVHSVSFSPNGLWLATGSWDKTIRIYDTKTFTLQKTFLGHTDAVNTAAFSPDSAFLATASYDKTVRIWNMDSGATTLVLSHPDAVRDVAYSPNGRFLASAGADRRVRLWNAADGKLLEAMAGHLDAITTVAFSPDNHRLASGGSDRRVRLWRLSSSDGLMRLAHADWVYGVAFSSDGRWITTGGWDRSVNLWDLQNGKKLWTTKEHTAGVYVAILSPDNTLVASGGYDNTVRIFESQSGRQIRVLTAHKDRTMCLAFSPDGKTLATGSFDKTVRLWDVSTGNQLATFGEHGDRVYAIAFSPDGKFLATSSADKRVRLYDVAGRKLVREHQGHEDWVSGVAFSPDGKLLASSGKDQWVLVWRVDDWREMFRLHGHKQWVNHVAFSHNGRWLASTGDDGLVILWDVQTGKPVLQIKASGSVLNAIFSPDDKQLAVTDYDAVILYPMEKLSPEKDPREIQTESESLAGLKLQGFDLVPLESSP